MKQIKKTLTTIIANTLVAGALLLVGCNTQSDFFKNEYEYEMMYSGYQITLSYEVPGAVCRVHDISDTQKTSNKNQYGKEFPPTLVGKISLDSNKNIIEVFNEKHEYESIARYSDPGDRINRLMGQAQLDSLIREGIKYNQQFQGGMP